MRLQLGLKKLPDDLRPRSLARAFLEFDVADAETIALAPNDVEWMSEDRMRTRDHDGNTIILTVDDATVRQRCAAMMSQQRRRGREPKTKQRRSRSVSPYVDHNHQQQRSDNAIYFTNSPNKNNRSLACKSNQQLLHPSRLNRKDVSPNSRRGQQQSAVGNDDAYARVKPKPPQGRSAKLSPAGALGRGDDNDSFTYPRLPERMPLLNHDSYNNSAALAAVANSNSNRFVNSSRQKRNASPVKTTLDNLHDGFYV